MKKLLSYFFPIIFLLGCARFGDQLGPKPIEINIVQGSDLFNSDLASLEVDSLHNFLNIHLRFKYKALQKFPFPKHKNNETLTGTAFKFSLYDNGKLIEGARLSPKKGANYLGYNNWLGNSFTFTSDTIDLRNAQQISFEIPFYAFQKLKAGEHELELKIIQETFCSPFKIRQFVRTDTLGDSIYKDTRHFIKAPLIWCVAKFKVTIPPIFKTMIYGHGIELRNDSVYSPAGMDNTIWNSSYPDIYWTVSSPADHFYWSSDYETSTAHYQTKDTFCLYHYTPNDTISIGVWDHDNLSRDDYISCGNFSINEFPQGKIKCFAFDNTKKFELRVERAGFINK